jgi:hypothetical protein
MGLFKREISEITAINNELERLHAKIGVKDPMTNRYIWERIVLLQDTLNKIARKINGLEY